MSHTNPFHNPTYSYIYFFKIYFSISSALSITIWCSGQFLLSLWYLSIYLSIYISIYQSINQSIYISLSLYLCYSPLEHKSSVTRFVSLQFLNLRQSVRFPGHEISPTQNLLRTQDNTVTVSQCKRKHPYFELDSNSRSQLSSRRNHFLP
jgi:hypothetical protein